MQSEDGIFCPVQHQLWARFRLSCVHFRQIYLECLSYHLDQMMTLTGEKKKDNWKVNSTRLVKADSQFL